VSETPANILERIVATKRVELAAAEARLPLAISPGR
jgi:hypothetical protein